MLSQSPKLVIIAKGKPREIEMGQELTIGRGYSNLLRLEGEEISRVHAILYRRNQDFILRDLDSKNGVFVNGNRVLTARLDPGDRLQVGKYKMVFNPPANFDYKYLAISGQNGTPAAGVESEPDVDISDDNLAYSQIFSAAVRDDSLATGEQRLEQGMLREEVLLLTRVEMEEWVKLQKGVSTEKAADYQEDFFNCLLKDEVPADEKKPEFTTAVLRALVKILSADRGVVVLRDSKTDSLRPGAIVPDKGDVAVNRVVLQAAFAEGKTIICPSTENCGLFRDSNTVLRDRISSLISVPLGRDEVIGLLYIDRLEEAEGFNLAQLLAAVRVGRLLEMHLGENANAK